MTSTLALVHATDAENPTVGDLKLVNGQLVFATGVDAIMQHLRIRLGHFKGEWFLDRREGIPYFQSILRKNVDERVVRSIFRQALRTAPGVAEVLSLQLNINRATRRATLDFKVRLTDGEVASADAWAPFVYEV